ncbi:hypothetical protein [Microbispora sp. CA-102843]|uniref:hypothetical protein n=1 Tax=Microbispora sp. CA-102843 TaxID=3239952 RepID=UPI003D8D5836
MSTRKKASRRPLIVALVLSLLANAAAWGLLLATWPGRAILRQMTELARLAWFIAFGTPPRDPFRDTESDH